MRWRVCHAETGRYSSARTRTSIRNGMDIWRPAASSRVGGRGRSSGRSTMTPECSVGGSEPVRLKAERSAWWKARALWPSPIVWSQTKRMVPSRKTRSFQRGLSSGKSMSRAKGSSMIAQGLLSSLPKNCTTSLRSTNGRRFHSGDSLGKGRYE